MARIPPLQLDTWRALLNAHAALVAHAEGALADAGLPPLGWYDLLWAVRNSPGKHIRMADLADSLTITRGGATKLTNRLESAGLLRRAPVDDDGRGLYAELTPAGEELLRKMWPVYAGALNATIGSAISDQEAKVITKALRRAASAL